MDVFVLRHVQVVMCVATEMRIRPFQPLVLSYNETGTCCSEEVQQQKRVKLSCPDHFCSLWFLSVSSLKFHQSFIALLPTQPLKGKCMDVCDVFFKGYLELFCINRCSRSSRGGHKRSPSLILPSPLLSFLRSPGMQAFPVLCSQLQHHVAGG